MVILSPGANAPSTSTFVTWSSTTMPAAAANQRALDSLRLDMSSRFSRSAQVGGAAPAQRLIVHIRGVVPAALALRIGTGFRFDLQSALLQADARSQEKK